MPRKLLDIPKERRFAGPAPIWKRFFAFAIDLTVIDLVIIFPFKGVISKLIPPDTSYSQAYNLVVHEPNVARLLSVITVIAAVISVLYFSALEWKLNQTIGKIFMDIYVVSELKKISYWQALVRSLFLLPVFPFILLWIADPIVMLFNKSNQRLSEILSKTRTIQNYAIH